MRFLAKGERASANKKENNLETRLYWHFGELFGDVNFRLFQHNPPISADRNVRSRRGSPRRRRCQAPMPIPAAPNGGSGWKSAAPIPPINRHPGRKERSD